MDDNQMITMDDDIRNEIYEIRGQRVMLDRDLARRYQVETKNLNKAVKRNQRRFPSDFMFQLTWDEWEQLSEKLFDRSRFQNGSKIDKNLSESPTANERLRFQIGTSNRKTLTETERMTARGGDRYLPYAFTEQGVAMLSSVLHSDVAIDMNVKIMRAFVAVRRRLPLVTSAEDIEDLRSRVRSLEAMAQGSQEQLSDVRQAVEGIYEALNRLQEPSPPEPLPPVGFRAIEEQRRKQE